MSEIAVTGDMEGKIPPDHGTTSRHSTRKPARNHSTISLWNEGDMPIPMVRMTTAWQAPGPPPHTFPQHGQCMGSMESKEQ